MYTSTTIIKIMDAMLSLFGCFFAGGSPTYSGLGKGPINPPGPEMVRTDRKDLNSNKTKANKVDAGHDTILTRKILQTHFTNAKTERPYLQLLSVGSRIALHIARHAPRGWDYHDLQTD